MRTNIVIDELVGEAFRCADVGRKRESVDLALREGAAREGDDQVLYPLAISKKSEAVGRFVKMLDLGLPFGTTGFVYGEVLQGAGTTADFWRIESTRARSASTICSIRWSAMKKPHGSAPS